MRLLFVFDIGFDRSGPSVHLLQDVLIETLAQGHDVHTILKKTNGTDEEMPAELRDNPRFSYEAIEWPSNKGGNFINRYISELKYANICGKRALAEGNFDAIFLQSNVITYFYMRQLKKLKSRIVYNVQDIFPYNLKLSGQLPLERLTFPIFRKLQNLGYQKANKIVTISEDMKQMLIDDGVDKEKIEVIFNWSYADTLICEETIASENTYNLHMDHSKFNVVYAGNIGKMQNVELLARTAYTMREERSVHFYIIGEGTNKEAVRHIVAGLNNVTILPMQPSRFAESIYAQADLNVIPLMPGGIRTALPSKTATVLRVNKPVVFCVDKSNSLASLFNSEEGVVFTDNVSEISLKNTIIDMSKKYKRKEFDRTNIVEEYFSTKNARKYVKILQGEYYDR